MLGRKLAVVVVIAVLGAGAALVLLGCGSQTATKGKPSATAAPPTTHADTATTATTTTTSAGVTLSNPPSPEQTASVAADAYSLKLNEFGGSDPISMSSQGNTDFKIESSALSIPTGGTPEGYFELLKGCSWGDCTNNSGAPFPLRVSDVKAGQLATSASCQTATANGNWDNAYDIWFNASRSAGQTKNSAGAHLEMMIWLDHTPAAVPIGSLRASNVQLAGNTYDVWYGGNNTLSYVLRRPSSGISTDLYPLIKDAVQRGFLQPSWWLLDVEMGFEIWNGGAGLGCSSFAVGAS